jgi:hypothetical protein
VLTGTDRFAGLLNYCDLVSTPGTPRTWFLSIGGRSVPDYGAPFSFQVIAKRQREAVVFEEGGGATTDTILRIMPSLLLKT